VEAASPASPVSPVPRRPLLLPLPLRELPLPRVPPRPPRLLVPLVMASVAVAAVPVVPVEHRAAVVVRTAVLVGRLLALALGMCPMSTAKLTSPSSTKPVCGLATSHLSCV
jgi:hypothetical protein